MAEPAGSPGAAATVAVTPGLLLTSRALNSLFNRFAEQMPGATELEVENAMYAYLHRCDQVAAGMAKDWMRWKATGTR